MKAVRFKEVNVELGKSQDQYITLPAYRDDDGCIVVKYKLNIFERLKILFTGNLWLLTLTFNHPFQPVKLDVNTPFRKNNAERA